MTPEEIRELRQKKRNEVASQTSVKYLLPIGQNRSLLVLIASSVISITIVGIGLYLYEAILLLYNSIFSSNSAGLLNFATTSIIVATTFLAIKSQKFDRYIQEQIKDTLFVMRSDAILSGEIPESYIPIEQRNMIPFENWLDQFTIGSQFPVLQTMSKYMKAASEEDSSSDIGSGDDDMDLPEPSTKKRHFEPPKKKKYQMYSGQWGRDQIQCTLYQFDVKEELQDSVFAKLKHIATSFATPKLWIENAVLITEETTETVLSKKIGSSKKHRGGSTQQTPEGHIYFMLQETTTLSELPSDVKNRRKISKETLNLMKMYAEHVTKLHEEGLFGKLSLSNAYWITKGFDGWVTSFSPEWIFAEQLTDEQKERKKKDEIMEFAAILLEFLYDIPLEEISKLRNKAVVYLSNIQPEEVWGLSIQIEANPTMKNLLASMFGFADNRPSMSMVAATLKECYEEREKLGQRR